MIATGHDDYALLEGVESVGTPLECIDAVDLDRLAIAAPAFVVDALLPVGALVLLSGDTGSCKTALLLHTALALALGVPIGGRFAPMADAGPVLYLNGEMDEALLQRTVRETRAGLGDVGATLERRRLVFEGAHGMATIRFKADRSDVEERTRFEATIAEHRPSLIVIDTQRALFDLDEKEAVEVRSEFSWLKRLASTYRLCIVVVHHLRKVGPTSNSERERVSGSRDLVAAVDVHLAAKAANGRPMSALLVDKTRYAVGAVRAGVEFPVDAIYEPPATLGETGRSTFVIGPAAAADAALESETAVQRDILARLESEGPLTRNQIGAGVRGSGNIKRAFSELRERGRIVPSGRKVGRSDLWRLAGGVADGLPFGEDGLKDGPFRGHADDEHAEKRVATRFEHGPVDGGHNAPARQNRRRTTPSAEGEGSSRSRHGDEYGPMAQLLVEGHVQRPSSPDRFSDRSKVCGRCRKLGSVRASDGWCRQCVEAVV